MQEIDSTYEDSLPIARHRGSRRRLFVLGGFLLPLVALILAVPLININRFQRRIVSSLSESLGRPIHLDSISLTVFPLPGLTIENLVVAEDPAFGAEPFVRASSVRATLRISSLWRRRVEFSRISFTEPSINLVRTRQGKWNLESILLQASRMDAAPTAQIRASGTPRFPYIEATEARLNFKLNQEKMPISVTEAEIALWLSSPQQWQLRLEGRPVRTDTNVFDTGTLHVEGTLGHAAAFNTMPINLKGDWRDVPLGQASKVLSGGDAGLRGTMTLSALVHGTMGQSAVETTLHIADLRRADFVPAQTLTMDTACSAVQSLTFQSLTDIHCNWPPAASSSTDQPQAFTLTGSIPDTRNFSSASLDLATPGIPAATLLSWSHVASDHVSSKMTASGTLTGSISLRPGWQWSGQFTIPDGTLLVPSVSQTSIVSTPLTMRLISLVGNGQRPQFVLAPLPLAFGSVDFATLEGRFDQAGYTLHLTGTSLPTKLLAVGSALPLIGEGLATIVPSADTPAPFRFDLISTRSWGSVQIWHLNNRSAAVPSRHTRRR